MNNKITLKVNDNDTVAASSDFGNTSSGNVILGSAGDNLSNYLHIEFGKSWEGYTKTILFKPTGAVEQVSDDILLNIVDYYLPSSIMYKGLLRVQIEGRITVNNVTSTGHSVSIDCEVLQTIKASTQTSAGEQIHGGDMFKSDYCKGIGRGNTNRVDLADDVNILGGIASKLDVSTYDAQVINSTIMQPSAPELVAARGGYSSINGRFANIEQVVVNFINKGGKIDGTDNTTVLNTLINSLPVGSKITFPNGEYTFMGTIILKEGITLQGNSGMFVDIQTYNCVRFLHTPTTVNVDLFSISSCTGFKVDGISCLGNTNSRYCYDIHDCRNFKISNCFLRNFDSILNVSGLIHSSFENILMQVGRTYILRMSDENLQGGSTTTDFTKCYFSSSLNVGMICTKMGFGIVFDKCIFESCHNGLDIYTGNIIEFYNLYSENIPSDVSYGNLPLIQLGVNGADETGYPTGVCSVHGGDLGGCNGSGTIMGSAFKLGRFSQLSIFGTNFRAYKNILLYDVISPCLVNAYSANHTYVMHSLMDDMTTLIKKGVYVGCTVNGADVSSNRLTANIAGLTVDRPDFPYHFAGMAYFDLSVYKPIWFDGGGWVDADGNSMAYRLLNSVSPANNATGISVNTTIIATFNVEVYVSDVTTSKFILKDSGSVAVAGTVVRSGATNQIVTFTPSAPLNSLSIYTFTVSLNVRGVNKIIGRYDEVFTFTTA
jgi:hypothetical protein